MSKKKSLITALVLVAVIGLSITAGTFAYFQWTTGAEGGTSVNVTIEMGGITMHIEPEQTGFVGLYPTAHCENNVRYGDALVTIVNNTGTLALPSFKLKVKVTDKEGNGVPADALEHIHYSVVPIETTKDASGNPVKGDTSYTCASVPSVKSTDAGGLLTNGDGEVTSSFTFQNVAIDGSYTHVPSVGDKSSTGVSTTAGYLPRQYFVSGDNTGDTAGITYLGGTYTTTYQYYRVYVWVDEGYTSTIVGNVVSDPLQNAKIEITWSEESMVQQVSGSDEGPVLAAGLYDNDGNLTTWDDLVDNGDITVEGTVITASKPGLTGDLVIPEGITIVRGFDSEYGEECRDSAITSVIIPASVTSIGNGAFSYNCSLTSVAFAENSRLTSIEDFAFYGAGLHSIEIPVGVTYIGDSALYAGSLSSITFKGTITQWNAITKGTVWLSYFSDVTKVVCSDGEVTLWQ